MNVIHDESELPAQEYKHVFYIRSLCDPTVYVRGNDGAVFRRSDGLMWEQPAYIVKWFESGVTREIGTCKEDHSVYHYAKQKAAA